MIYIYILQLFNSFVFPFLLILCSDLGVHVDGFIANVAHSFIVGASKVKKQKKQTHVHITPWSQFCIISCESWSRLFLFFYMQENPVTGRKADVIKAAHLCAEAALRLVKPGNQVRLSVSWGFSTSAVIRSNILCRGVLWSSKHLNDLL